MTNQERLEMIKHYEGLAATCASIGFAAAARVWRYRVEVLRDLDHPVTQNLLKKEEA